MAPRAALIVLYISTTVFADVFSGQPPVNANPTDTNNPLLVGKRFPFNQIPFKADTTSSERGEQTGYNQCNSTTANKDSLCQTAILNSLDDFCLWAPPKPNTAIQDSESFLVAWCTKAKHGARLIPEGALTGVQFIKTPSYVQVTGHLKQELLNMPAEDTGGELDSGGQDGRGNPIGALAYSSALKGGTADVPIQGVSWHNFIGSGQFCFKVCDQTAENPVGLCQHIYDRIGCAYNAPAAYTDGVFLSCKGEDQDPVGIYTGADGVVTTYHQPPEKDGVITTVPYEPRMPASSECSTFTSAKIYTELGSVKTTPPTNPNGPTSPVTGPNSKPTTGPNSGDSSGNSTNPDDGTGAAFPMSVSMVGVVAAALLGVAFGA